MKEKMKAVNQTIKKISWILKNPYLKNYTVTLINEFVYSNCSISKIVEKNQTTIEFTKENSDTLFISISSDSNEITITYNENDIASFKKIKRCGNEIEVTENSSSVLRKNGKIISSHKIEKNKLYKGNCLVKSKLTNCLKHRRLNMKTHIQFMKKLKYCPMVGPL